MAEEAGTYTVTVEASDGSLSDTQTFTWTVLVPHTLSITSGASGDPDTVASEGTVSLSVSATDSRGDTLSYLWSASCPELGSSGSFDSAESQTPSWTAPPNITGSPQACTISVVVSNAAGLTASDRVNGTRVSNPPSYATRCSGVRASGLHAPPRLPPSRAGLPLGFHRAGSGWVISPI